jgi:hypothetical protein
MFKNTRLGHWHLQHRCYLGVLGLSFSTHSRILLSSEYFYHKIFINEKYLEKQNDKFSRTSIIEAKARYGSAARRLRNTGIDDLCHRSSSIPGVTLQHLLIFWLPMWNGPQLYWHRHCSDCSNTLIYAHTASRTFSTCDMSLGSLTVAIRKAGDFVESLEPYLDSDVLWKGKANALASVVVTGAAWPHTSEGEVMNGARV